MLRCVFVVGSIFAYNNFFSYEFTVSLFFADLMILSELKIRLEFTQLLPLVPGRGTDFSYSAKVGKSEVRGNRLSCSSSLFTIAFDFLFSFLSNFYYCGWTAKSALTPDTPVCEVILVLSTTLCVRSL